MLGHEGGNLDLQVVAVVFKLCNIPVGVCGKMVRSQCTLSVSILASYRVIFLIYLEVIFFPLACVML